MITLGNLNNINNMCKKLRNAKDYTIWHGIGLAFASHFDTIKMREDIGYKIVTFNDIDEYFIDKVLYVEDGSKLYRYISTHQPTKNTTVDVISEIQETRRGVKLIIDKNSVNTNFIIPRVDENDTDTTYCEDVSLYINYFNTLEIQYSKIVDNACIDNDIFQNILTEKEKPIEMYLDANKRIRITSKMLVGAKSTDTLYYNLYKNVKDHDNIYVVEFIVVSDTYSVKYIYKFINY